MAVPARAAPDLKDVKGQESAKRALEIAAAGGHNLLMIGPPGAGKSMMAQRLPGLLPPLDAAEALEISMVRSLAGELTDGAISKERPFRNPHHSASMAALVGGGLKVKPGEVSLAHLGVLFLDELPEFQRGVLDSLRQPMESGEAVVARANAHVRYPARFQLVAAMNPCTGIAFLMPYVRFRLTARKERRFSDKPMTLGEHLRKQRFERGQRQYDVANELDVNVWTYFLWEGGRSIPTVRHYPAILKYLGYDPFPAPLTLGGRIRARRRQLGLSMKRAAQKIGIDEGTLRRWENDERRPKRGPHWLNSFLEELPSGSMA
jgi:transcriptional regulator with XRE-family HTH domain